MPSWQTLGCTRWSSGPRRRCPPSKTSSEPGSLWAEVVVALHGGARCAAGRQHVHAASCPRSCAPACPRLPLTFREEECHHGLALAADAARSPTAADAEAQRQGIADARQAKYHLTGQTGAYIYMAPEVLQGKPYNEKVDCFGWVTHSASSRPASPVLLALPAPAVAPACPLPFNAVARCFSPAPSAPCRLHSPCARRFGVILYELLHRKMLLADIMYLGGADDAQAHAHKVAAGYRPPISEALPQGLRQLVKECQSGTPELRPR